jgi:hypothetical protein
MTLWNRMNLLGYGMSIQGSASWYLLELEVTAMKC